MYYNLSNFDLELIVLECVKNFRVCLRKWNVFK
ncbi:MAG: hypothetical protein XD90_2069 [Methanobacterium sp. 42_16]|nr:MAG: hypothetical protein XD90_2069 [Methanobacterium sp. 42_16]